MKNSNSLHKDGITHRKSRIIGVVFRTLTSHKSRSNRRQRLKVKNQRKKPGFGSDLKIQGLFRSEDKRKRKREKDNLAVA